jgi:hypothetical protein
MKTQTPDMEDKYMQRGVMNGIIDVPTYLKNSAYWGWTDDQITDASKFRYEPKSVRKIALAAGTDSLGRSLGQYQNDINSNTEVQDRVHSELDGLSAEIRGTNYSEPSTSSTTVDDNDANSQGQYGSEFEITEDDLDEAVEETRTYKTKKKTKKMFENQKALTSEEVLANSEVFGLEKEFMKAFDKSYGTASLSTIVNAVLSNEQIKDVDLFNLIQDSFTPVTDTLDKKSILKHLMILASFGIKDMDNDMVQEGNIPVKGFVKDRINNTIKYGVQNFLYNLIGQKNNSTEKLTDSIGYITPKDNDESVLEEAILAMVLPFASGSSLDSTTVNDIAETIKVAIKRNPEASVSEIVEIVKLQLAQKIADRSNLNAVNTAMTVFGLARLITSSVFDPRTKEWLISKAIDKREVHLLTVGTIIAYKDKFVHADGSIEFWPNTAPKCQCGAKVHTNKPITEWKKENFKK